MVFDMVNYLVLYSRENFTTTKILAQLCIREKITRGLRASFPPKCKKEPSIFFLRAPENCHRLQCKSLLNVADLVNGMWKVAPENRKIIFGLLCIHVYIHVWVYSDDIISLSMPCKLHNYKATSHTVDRGPMILNQQWIWIKLVPTYSYS